MRYILINQAWALTNKAEILANAEANGIGTAWLQPMTNGFMGCKGFNPEQMTVIPDTVNQEPHLLDEVDYGLENAVAHADKIILVGNPPPVTCMYFNIVKDFFIVARQHGTLLPVG
jgi:hypothetical protein